MACMCGDSVCPRCFPENANYEAFLDYLETKWRSGQYSCVYQGLNLMNEDYHDQFIALARSIWEDGYNNGVTETKQEQFYEGKED